MPPSVDSAGGGQGDSGEDFEAKKAKLRRQLWARPQDSAALQQLATLQQDAGDVTDFVDFARSLCRHDGRAWNSVSRTLHQTLGRTADAVEVLLEARRADSTRAEVCCRLARLQPSHALNWYEQALVADPSWSAALVGAAEEHRRAEDFAEAARLYMAAHSLTPLGPRSLCRLGEVLVQDQRGAEGREVLMQAIQQGEGKYKALAASTLALSCVLDGQQAEALAHCVAAEQLHAAVDPNSEEMRRAKMLTGLTLLRAGDVEGSLAALAAAAALRPASAGPRPGAGPAGGQQWDEVLHAQLGVAEALRGNVAASEAHFADARRRAPRGPRPDTLAGEALLRHTTGALLEAEALLMQALASDRDHPLPLLRMGHLLLCRRDLDKSMQFLQKCLQQRAGTLTFASAERGTAHLYLCIVHHLRSAGDSKVRRNPGQPHVDQIALDHFKHGLGFQPAMRQALASLDGSSWHAAQDAGRLLVKGTPTRMGSMFLSVEQAGIVLHYAAEYGLVHRQQKPVDRPPTAKPPSPPQAAPAAGCYEPDAPTPSHSNAPTLIGTDSTTAPTSALSRHASDAALGLEDGFAVAATGVPPRCHWNTPTCRACAAAVSVEQTLAAADIDFGECISRAESVAVYRGTQLSCGREVVVKMLQADGGAPDDAKAADELAAEITMMASLRHPRIVSFVGACLDLPQLALVTELAPGGNLHHALHVRRRPLSRADRFQLATELLEGVRYLHARQPAVAHLDLKSMNLVLDSTGQHLQICDFGLSRALDAGADVQDSLRCRGGSPRYMAPECHDTSLGPVTEKVDVWASGCILIELFGDVLPYAECSNVQQIVNEMLVHQRSPSIPEQVEVPVQSVIKSMHAFASSGRIAVVQALLQLQAAATSAENRSRLQWIS